MSRQEWRAPRRAVMWMGILLSAASMEAASQECFEEAPSVRDGGGAYDQVSPTHLTSKNRKVIAKLFERLEGRWSGNSSGYFCRGRKGAARKEVDGYRIEMKATRDDPDKISLVSDMTSIDNTTTRTEKLRLFLSDDTLRVDVDDRGGDVQILHMAQNGSEIEFLHKVITSSGSDAGLTVTETVRRIRVSTASLSIEFNIYLIGGLASGSTWKLTRK